VCVIIERYAGIAFALVVFACDDYLALKTINTLTSTATAGATTGGGAGESELSMHKYLSIVMKLPLDLQMVLCNRTFGSGKDIISREKREMGFKKVARLFLQPQQQPQQE
jgi:hypothetical protein